MKTIPTTLFHRLLLPEQPDAAPPAGPRAEPRAGLHPAIILLHGRGSDEEDLLGLAPELDGRFMVLSARAPLPFPYGGYTWFEMNGDGMRDDKGFHSSLATLSRFIDDVSAGYPIDRSRLFLFGFSMGTIMSYALAGTRPGVFRGVVANSGFIPEDPSLVLRWKELGGTEFFITHGTEDPVIPVAKARRAREILSGAGAVANNMYRSHEIAGKLARAKASSMSEQVRTSGCVRSRTSFLSTN